MRQCMWSYPPLPCHAVYTDWTSTKKASKNYLACIQVNKCSWYPDVHVMIRAASCFVSLSWEGELPKMGKMLCWYFQRGEATGPRARASAILLFFFICVQISTTTSLRWLQRCPRLRDSSLPGSLEMCLHCWILCLSPELFIHTCWSHLLSHQGQAAEGCETDTQAERRCKVDLVPKTLIKRRGLRTQLPSRSQRTVQVACPAEGPVSGLVAALRDCRDDIEYWFVRGFNRSTEAGQVAACTEATVTVCDHGNWSSGETNIGQTGLVSLRIAVSFFLCMSSWSENQGWTLYYEENTNHKCGGRIHTKKNLYKISQWREELNEWMNEALSAQVFVCR